MSSAPSWEAVLDAVADDVRRTAELLFADREGTATDYMHFIAPVSLPEISDMPPVPGELRTRICQLRAQITALQEELASALAESRHPHRVLTADVPGRPLYVDRKI